jgi:hypothetical protein
MDGKLRSRRMTTSVERVFRRLTNGYYREILMHYIHFIDDGGNILSSKLDKAIERGLWQRAIGNERSRYGELEYQFPDEDKPCRMLALGRDEEDYRYGRS